MEQFSSRSFFGCVAAILTVSFACFVNFGHASLIEYSDFSDVSNLQLNGNASQSGTALRLTPNANNQRGTAFVNDRVELGSGFSTTFNIDITDVSATNGGADGMLFILHNDPRGVTALGFTGGHRGYTGATITNSVALGFQTWTQDDTQILANGVQLIEVDSGFTGAVTNYDVFVSWDATSQIMSIDHAGLASPLTTTVDLISILGSHYAYAGFSAGTGGGNATHQVNSWTFTSVPEPTTAISLVVMLGGLAISRRRKRVVA